MPSFLRLSQLYLSEHRIAKQRRMTLKWLVLRTLDISVLFLSWPCLFIMIALSTMFPEEITSDDSEISLNIYYCHQSTTTTADLFLALSKTCQSIIRRQDAKDWFKCREHFYRWNLLVEHNWLRMNFEPRIGRLRIVVIAVGEIALGFQSIRQTPSILFRHSVSKAITFADGISATRVCNHSTARRDSCLCPSDCLHSAIDNARLRKRQVVFTRERRSS